MASKHTKCEIWGTICVVAKCKGQLGGREKLHFCTLQAWVETGLPTTLPHGLDEWKGRAALL